MNKTTYILLGMLFFINISFTLALDSYGTKQIDEQFTFCQVCQDATYIKLSSIETPNSTVQIGSNMTAQGTGQYCYNYTPTQIGRYDFRGISDGCEKTWAVYVDVTSTGESMDISKSIFYLGLLVVLIIFFIFSIYNIWKVQSLGWSIFLICFAYILLIGIFLIGWQISENFLTSIPFLSSLMYILWLILMIGFFPFLIFIFLYLFQTMMQEKEVTRLENMGHSTTDALKRVKRGR